MTRREAIAAVLALAASARVSAQARVSTLIGTGTPGFSDREVNNPYGVIIGPGGLFFCDLDNQRVRWIDLRRGTTTTIAGSGEKGHTGDAGLATQATLNMPHEIQFDASGNLYIAERDSHVVRKVQVKTGIISTVAGTGVAGFSGDGGPASQAQLRQPHSIAIDAQNRLLICDIGNQRIRRVDLTSGTIETFAGTGIPAPTPDGAPRVGTPLNGPRTFAFGSGGTLYLALREGNAIYRLQPSTDTWHHVAGSGTQGYSGDGGSAREAQLRGPKGLAFDQGRNALFVADTENHVIRKVDLQRGIITTVLGSGQRGDGPETDPLTCKLSRPHGLFVDPSGTLYVTDSEAHRIRVLRG